MFAKWSFFGLACRFSRLHDVYAGVSPGLRHEQAGAEGNGFPPEPIRISADLIQYELLPVTTLMPAGRSLLLRATPNLRHWTWMPVGSADQAYVHVSTAASVDRGPATPEARPKSCYVKPTPRAAAQYQLRLGGSDKGCQPRRIEQPGCLLRESKAPET